MGDVITDDDIRRAVAPNAFQAGLQYRTDRRVRDLRVVADGATVDAEVLGSRRSSYCQSIQLIRNPNGRLTAAGSCTCPVGFNCKHVAAVLFEYRHRIARQRRLADAPSLGARRDTGRAGHSGDWPQPGRVDDGDRKPPLPFEVDAWLRSLDAAQEEESEDYPPSVRKRLLYVLDRGPHSGGLIVDVRSIDLTHARSGLMIPCPVGPRRSNPFRRAA